MPMNRTISALVLLPLSAWGQKPVVDSVVNAASYAIGGYATDSPPTTIPILGLGSIATIFGTNLAATTAEAPGVPLPWALAGTSVSVYGVAAPLFYVSPTQINFQWPQGVADPAGASSAQGVVVSTAAGLSNVYTAVSGLGASALGVFTQNASGCGPGAVINVSADGGVSLNSPSNSAQPGGYISVYGTGLGDVYVASAMPPPDGSPTPLSPLAPTHDFVAVMFDFVMSNYEGLGPYSWQGMAPGLVGVAQLNIQIPTTARLGCNVPLQLIGDYNITAPVTISIAAGGGQCADPPSQGDGLIEWQKTVTTTATNAVTESDTLTVSLQSSPGRQVPPAPPYAQTYAQGVQLPPAQTYFGPACPIPGYLSLGAGTVTAQGSGIGLVQTAAAPLQGGTAVATAQLPSLGFAPIPPVQSGQAALTVYRASLPNGSIQPGSFTVSASGGADVGAFQSTVQIGSPIQIAQPLAGQTLPTGAGGITLTWTGGDADAWVTVKLVGDFGYYQSYPEEYLARASDGSIQIPEPYDLYGAGLEMVIEVVPDPSVTPSFSATGMPLGGQHTWKYTYIYQGLTAEPQTCTTPQCLP